MELVVRCLTLSALLAGIPALRLVKSHFPSHVIRGRSMNLTCDYDSNGKSIYLVKWYKDAREFYSYAPGKPGRTFDIPGVNVNEALSTSTSVLLEGVDLSTEGTYGCEVTVDQSFDTVISMGPVQVVELPQSGPDVTGFYRDSMEEGDHVRVNCTSYRSRPAATLTWYINGARSDSGFLRTYPPVATSGDLLTVTLGLDFRLRRSHFGPTGQVILKCTAEIESVFYNSADVRITSMAMAMRSRLSSVQCTFRRTYNWPDHRGSKRVVQVLSGPTHQHIDDGGLLELLSGPSISHTVRPLQVQHQVAYLSSTFCAGHAYRPSILSVMSAFVAYCLLWLQGG